MVGLFYPSFHLLMSDLSERKAGIREAMLARRGDLSLGEQSKAAKEILEILKENFPWPELNRIALYRAIGGEVATVTVEQWLRSQNKVLCFPRSNPEQCTIEMVAMGPKDRWVSGPWNTFEPAAGRPETPPSQMDLVLVPGVAFDRHGRRIGRGKGCYDRWLKNFAGIRVGLAHAFQLLEEIPEEPFDEGVDFIVTPEGLIKS